MAEMVGRPHMASQLPKLLQLQIGTLDKDQEQVYADFPRVPRAATPVRGSIHCNTFLLRHEFVSSDYIAGGL